MNKLENAPTASFTNLFQYASQVSSSEWVKDVYYPDNKIDGRGVDAIICDNGFDVQHQEFFDANGKTRVQLVDWNYLLASGSRLIASGADGYNEWRSKDFTVNSIKDTVDYLIASASSSANSLNGYFGASTAEDGPSTLRRDLRLCSASMLNYFPQIGGSAPLHGTHVAGTVVGQTVGWASSASIYVLSNTGGAGRSANQEEKAIYLFHALKKAAGIDNPTIVNESQGSRVSVDWYHGFLKYHYIAGNEQSTEITPFSDFIEPLEAESMPYETQFAEYVPKQLNLYFSGSSGIGRKMNLWTGWTGSLEIEPKLDLQRFRQFMQSATKEYHWYANQKTIASHESHFQTHSVPANIGNSDMYIWQSKALDEGVVFCRSAMNESQVMSRRSDFEARGAYLFTGSKALPNQMAIHGNVYSSRRYPRGFYVTRSFTSIQENRFESIGVSVNGFWGAQGRQSIDQIQSKIDEIGANLPANLPFPLSGEAYFHWPQFYMDSSGDSPFWYMPAGTTFGSVHASRNYAQAKADGIIPIPHLSASTIHPETLGLGYAMTASGGFPPGTSMSVTPIYSNISLFEPFSADNSLNFTHFVKAGQFDVFGSTPSTDTVTGNAYQKNADGEISQGALNLSQSFFYRTGSDHLYLDPVVAIKSLTSFQNSTASAGVSITLVSGSQIPGYSAPDISDNQYWEYQAATGEYISKLDDNCGILETTAWQNGTDGFWDIDWPVPSGYHLIGHRIAIHNDQHWWLWQHTKDHPADESPLSFGNANRPSYRSRAGKSNRWGMFATSSTDNIFEWFTNGGTKPVYHPPLTFDWKREVNLYYSGKFEGYYINEGHGVATSNNNITAAYRFLPTEHQFTTEQPDALKLPLLRHRYGGIQTITDRSYVQGGIGGHISTLYFHVDTGSGHLTNFTESFNPTIKSASFSGHTYYEIPSDKTASFEDFRQRDSIFELVNLPSEFTHSSGEDMTLGPFGQGGIFSDWRWGTLVTTSSIKDMSNVTPGLDKTFTLYMPYGDQVAPAFWDDRVIAVGNADIIQGPDPYGDIDWDSHELHTSSIGFVSNFYSQSYASSDVFRDSIIGGGGRKEAYAQYYESHILTASLLPELFQVTQSLKTLPNTSNLPYDTINTTSARGPRVDIYAPGTLIYSALPYSTLSKTNYWDIIYNTASRDIANKTGYNYNESSGLATDLYAKAASFGQPMDTHWGGVTTYGSSNYGTQLLQYNYHSQSGQYDLYKMVSGTSMASPQVAGVLCLYAQLNKNINWDIAKQFLKSTAYTGYIPDVAASAIYSSGSSLVPSLFGNEYWMNRHMVGNTLGGTAVSKGRRHVVTHNLALSLLSDNNSVIQDGVFIGSSDLHGRPVTQYVTNFVRFRQDHIMQFENADNSSIAGSQNLYLHWPFSNTAIENIKITTPKDSMLTNLIMSGSIELTAVEKLQEIELTVSNEISDVDIDVFIDNQFEVDPDDFLDSRTIVDPDGRMSIPTSSLD